MSRCDHIVGIHHHFDDLILESESEKFCLDYDDSITKFNYCPMCGFNLKGKLNVSTKNS